MVSILQWSIRMLHQSDGTLVPGPIEGPDGCPTDVAARLHVNAKRMCEVENELIDMMRRGEDVDTSGT